MLLLRRIESCCTFKQDLGEQRNLNILIRGLNALHTD